jgi:hypothetical protein
MSPLNTTTGYRSRVQLAAFQGQTSSVLGLLPTKAANLSPQAAVTHLVLHNVLQLFDLRLTVAGKHAGPAAHTH